MAAKARGSWKYVRWLILLGLLGLAAVAWLVLPGPFAHGVIIGILGALALIFGALLVFGRVMKKRLKSGLEPPPLPTRSWDYDMRVQDLDGNEVHLEEFRDTVLVLNFWATWCGPCLAEMPALQRLGEATSDLGVALACVTEEDREDVERFLRKREIGVPIYLLSGEKPECFKGRSIPATFVVDRTGTIALRHFGAAAWDDDRVVTFVRGLAARPQR